MTFNTTAQWTVQLHACCLHAKAGSSSSSSCVAILFKPYSPFRRHGGGCQGQYLQGQGLHQAMVLGNTEEGLRVAAGGPEHRLEQWHHLRTVGVHESARQWQRPEETACDEEHEEGHEEEKERQ